MAVTPVVLIVLDGWGYREEPDDNAIAAAHKPNWDRYWTAYPHALINTSGNAVGLPDGQMGNSEVGHMNLGAGRIVYQELTRIGAAIEDGSFYDNPVMCAAVDRAVAAGRAVHLMGLLSPGGVHSHEAHIHAAIQLAVRRGATEIYVHAILDGRDTPPRSAADSLAWMERTLAELRCGRIATMVGRYYAMDRDQRWDRVQQAYELIAQGKGAFQADTAAAGLDAAYARDENDEFLRPTVIGSPVPMRNGDAVLFMNFRADRARELTQAFTDETFTNFDRGPRPPLGAFVCLTQYQADIDAPVAFPPTELHNGLGEVVARAGHKQLRIAETEKYAHVTFFFNGGRETVFDGEDRKLIPSPRIATYDLQPEMSAPAVTRELVAAIESGRYALIVCNYANPDMVGHSGIFDAAVKAVEAIDACLGDVLDAARKVGAEVLVTADHGNVEMMSDPATGQAHTAHTTNPVPLLYVGREADIAEGGALCDLAPTILNLMGLPIPPEMTGRPLINPR